MYHVGDQEALRASSFTADANSLEAEIAAANQQMREKELAEITARNEARDKRLEAYKNLDPMTKLAMNPPSQEAIMRARQQWDISSKPDWEK